MGNEQWGLGAGGNHGPSTHHHHGTATDDHGSQKEKKKHRVCALWSIQNTNTQNINTTPIRIPTNLIAHTPAHRQLISLSVADYNKICK
jgi:hypothetical protein